MYKRPFRLKAVIFLLALISLFPLTAQEDDSLFYLSAIRTDDSFVVVGGRGGSWIGETIGTGVIFYSEDGVSFTEKEVDSPVPFRVGATDGTRVVVAGDGIISADGFFHSNSMFLSEDQGKTWEQVGGLYGEPVSMGPAFFGGTDMVEVLAYQNGYFTAITDGSSIYNSKDGRNWKMIGSSVSEPLGGALLNDRLVVWGFDRKIVIVKGSQYRKVRMKDAQTVSTVYYEDGIFKANGYYDCCFGEVEDGVTFYSYESTNLINWDQVYTGGESAAPKALLFTEGSHYGVPIGETGEAAGLTLNLSAELFDKDSGSEIIYGGGVFLFASYSALYTSQDGMTWSSLDLK